MKKYQIIYADPPWSYEYSISNSRKIENQYPTMNLEDICNLKVPSENNSVLFLWVTAPKLEEGLRVLKSWGFNYRSCAVWDKLVLGMGYWFRNQHELLLVGTKGNFSPPDPELRVSSIIKEQRGKHSSKPEHVRYLIGYWYPEETKLEMFARQRTGNLFQRDILWDVWGNEIESDLELLPKE